jgi:predicted dehydrogenase
MARDLLDRGLPFAIEKPAGLNADDVRGLAQLAESRNCFASVPLILGYSDLLGGLRQFASGGDAWRHLSFRFIAGPIERYLDSSCSWMLQRSHAGGGCAINLAVHFIDLFRRLTGSEVISVSARMIVDPDVADVELYAHLSLENEAGQLCAIETGYSFPRDADRQREFSFSLASITHYLEGRDNVLRATPRDGTPTRNIDLDFETDQFYGTFVERTLGDVRSGRRPLAGLDDMTSIMAVIDGAYDSHRHGGVPVKVAQRR